MVVPNLTQFLFLRYCVHKTTSLHKNTDNSFLSIGSPSGEKGALCAMHSVKLGGSVTVLMTSEMFASD